MHVLKGKKAVKEDKMEQQICGDNESKTTQTECPKLSIFVDHTGFLSIERGLKIRDFKDAFSDRKLIQLLGAILLSDEITMAAPDTELEIVSDDLKRVFGRLEKLIPGTTVIDSIRTFNFLDTQHHDHLEKGLVDAANKMAIELELLVNADRKELIKLITDLDRSGILPDNIKSYHVPLAFKSYAGISLEKLQEIWATQDRNLPWGHVYMIQQEKLNNALRKLFDKLNDVNKSQINSFLHAYFRKAFNELLSNMASSQFYSPTHHRGRLYLQGQKMVLNQLLSKAPSSHNSEYRESGQEFFPFQSLGPSLSLMGLWALSKARSKRIKEPHIVIKELLEESINPGSSNDVMHEIKSFRKVLSNYVCAVQVLPRETQGNGFADKHEEFYKKLDCLVGELKKDSSFVAVAKGWGRDIRETDPISVGDIVSVLLILCDPNNSLLYALPFVTDKLVKPGIKNILESYRIRISLRSILDDMDLADKTIQRTLEQ